MAFSAEVFVPARAEPRTPPRAPRHEEAAWATPLWGCPDLEIPAAPATPLRRPSPSPRCQLPAWRVAPAVSPATPTPARAGGGLGPSGVRRTWREAAAAPSTPATPAWLKSSTPRTPTPRRVAPHPAATPPAAPATPATSRKPGNPPTPASVKQRRDSAYAQPLALLGAGAGGVEELRKHFDSSSVSWALHRFQVGSGTFLRTKLVAIHLNGEDAPAMHRGWLNSRGPEAFSLLGDVSATLEVTRPEELSVKNLCQRLLPLFASDNLGDYSLQALQRDYESAVQRVGQARLSEAPATPSPTKEPLAEPEPVQVSVDEALRGVGAEGGNYNWALLEPNRLDLHACGSGGVEEMKRHLAEDKVLFGVLRLSFGPAAGSKKAALTPTPMLTPTGGSSGRITKHVLVHWMGPAVGAVKRGRWNAKSQDAAAEIGRHCAVSFRREARREADVDLEDIIRDLRRLTALDVAALRLSKEGYLAALLEETREREARARREAAAKASARKQEAPRQPPAPSLADAVAAVRDASGHLNWALCGWKQPPAGLPAAAPRQVLTPRSALGARWPGGAPRSPALGGC